MNKKSIVYLSYAEQGCDGNLAVGMTCEEINYEKTDFLK